MNKFDRNWVPFKKKKKQQQKKTNFPTYLP